jgi:hypothetical protein
MSTVEGMEGVEAPFVSTVEIVEGVEHARLG